MLGSPARAALPAVALPAALAPSPKKQKKNHLERSAGQGRGVPEHRAADADDGAHERHRPVNLRLLCIGRHGNLELSFLINN